MRFINLNKYFVSFIITISLLFLFGCTSIVIIPSYKIPFNNETKEAIAISSNVNLFYQETSGLYWDFNNKWSPFPLNLFPTYRTKGYQDVTSSLKNCKVKYHVLVTKPVFLQIKSHSKDREFTGSLFISNESTKNAALRWDKESVYTSLDKYKYPAPLKEGIILKKIELTIQLPNEDKGSFLADSAFYTPILNQYTLKDALPKLYVIINNFKAYAIDPTDFMFNDYNKKIYYLIPAMWSDDSIDVEIAFYEYDNFDDNYNETEKLKKINNNCFLLNKNSISYNNIYIKLLNYCLKNELKNPFIELFNKYSTPHYSPHLLEEKISEIIHQSSINNISHKSYSEENLYYIATTWLMEASMDPTMLMYSAIRSGSLELIKDLIKKGADINYVSNKITPFEFAKKIKQEHIATFLKESGSKINEYITTDRIIIKSQLAKKLNLDTNIIRNALTKAKSPFELIGKVNNEEIQLEYINPLQLLIEPSISVILQEGVSKHDSISIQIPPKSTFSSIEELLLLANEITELEDSLIQLNKKYEIESYLIQKDTVFYLTESQEEDILKYAENYFVSTGKVEAFLALIKNPNVILTPKRWEEVLTGATKFIPNSLKEKNQIIQLILTIMEHGKVDPNTELTYYSDDNFYAYKMCLLEKAARSNFTDVVKYLIKNGADIHKGEKIAEGDRILYWAISQRNKDITKLLLEKGAIIPQLGPEDQEDFDFLNQCLKEMRK